MLDLKPLHDLADQMAAAVGRVAAAVDRTKRITYPAACLFVAYAILTGLLIEEVIPLSNVVPLAFLAAVLGAAAFGGVGEALLAAALSYFAYVWFFEPQRSVAIEDSRQFLTMAYFLVVAIAVGILSTRLRRQLDLSRMAARHAGMLFEFSRIASAATTVGETNGIVVDFVARATGSGAVLLGPDATGDMRILAAHPPVKGLDEKLRAAAMLAWKRRLRVGWSAETFFPDLAWLVIPLGSSEPLAVLAVARWPGAAEPSAAEQQLLDTLADQSVVVLERARLSGEIAEAQRYRETERLRTALLSSVSHDLRTPLASIVGAATTLQSLGDRLTPENRITLADTIAGESRRLNRYIQNLLDMSRLDHGAMRAEAEWIDLRDVVSAARGRLRDALGAAPLDQSIPEEAAFVHADPALLEQIVVNVLDNAAKYGDPRGGVRVEGEVRDDSIILSVTDRGPGVPAARRERIFEPFNSADDGDRGAGGTGLGLSISRGFARAMGGDVLVRDAPGGRGARFEIVLPRSQPPAFSLDEGGATTPAVDDDAA